MKHLPLMSALALLVTPIQAATVSLSTQKTDHTTGQNQLFIEALSQAYQHNPDIHVGLRTYYAAVESIPLAKAGWLPTVTITGSGQHSKALSNAKSTTSGPSSRTRSNTASDTLALETSIKQNLFKGGETTYAIQSAYASVQSARMQFTGVEQTVLLNATKAYLDLWKSYETLKYRTASVGFRERVAAQVKAQEDVGEKTRSDVAEARSRLAGAIAEQLTAQSTVATARATYQQVIGQDILPETLKMPTLVVAKSTLPQTLPALKELALKQSPAIQQAIFTEKAQKSSVHIAQSALLPTVDFTASASRQKSNTQYHASFHEGATSRQKGFDYKNSGTVGVTMTIPLFQGGKSWSGVRKASQQRYQALSALKKAHLELTQNITSIWETLQSLEAAVRQIERQVSAAKLNLEGKRQEYIVGERTLTDTLDAEQSLVSAQVQLVAKQRDYQVTFYQLMSLYGALLPDSLGLPVDRHNVIEYTDSMSNKFFGTGNLRQPNSIED